MDKVDDEWRRSVVDRAVVAWLVQAAVGADGQRGGRDWRDAVVFGFISAGSETSSPSAQDKAEVEAVMTDRSDRRRRGWLTVAVSDVSVIVVEAVMVVVEGVLVLPLRDQ